MKFCFFLQRRFAYLGHALAVHIAKNDSAAIFCGVVQVRTGYDFLKKQTDVPYTGLLLEEDIHRSLKDEEINHDFLQELEQDYGIPNLWPYVYIDRIIMSNQLSREYPYDSPILSYDDMLRRIQVTAKAIVGFLDSEKPDVIVTSVIGSMASHMLYHFAKKRGIRTIHIDFARVGTRIALTEDIRTLTGARKKYEEMRAGRSSSRRPDAEKFLKEFREKPAHYDEKAVPGYYSRTTKSAHITFLRPKHLAQSIPWHIKTFVADLKRTRDPDYTDIYIWWSIWDKIKRKTRGILGYEAFYTVPSWDKPFAYYPMHIDPEVASMLYGPYYARQIDLIRAIARSLPITMPLYIKEHPGMIGYRARAYYRELKNIPNVHLINPNVSGLKLAEKAALTITITSTNAWEALMFKKPVITFGDVFFNDIPGVERCRGYEELPYLIKKQLEAHDHDESALTDYIAAILEDSIEVDFSELWNRAAAYDEIVQDEGMIRLAHGISRLAHA